MDTYTVRQVYKRHIEEKEYRVYVYFDGDGVPLYVGQSKDVCSRLDFHLGEGWAGLPSALGEVLRDNRPGSGSWQVHLYESDQQASLEKELIATLHPALNTALSTQSSVSRYVKVDEMQVGLTEGLF
ncbi:MAG: hypothetical protein E6Q97_21060 [Desulfurellales bacterium]|nr:MAG: hypothetical protein E6Q97_21060 [Desulfurellales bacterium]